MLSSSMLKEEVDVIVELVAQGKIDEARQRLVRIVPEVSSEYGRGAILALNGILNQIESKNLDRLSDPPKILRAVERIPKMHMIDDRDKGYLQTVAKWAKKTKSQPKDPGQTKDSASANPQ